MKKKRLISVLLCVAMLAPMASMSMPADAQEETQGVSSSVGIQEDIGEPGVDYVDGEVLVKFNLPISGLSEGQSADFLGDIDCVITEAFNVDHDDGILIDDKFTYTDTVELFESDLADLIILKSETLSTREILSKLIGLEYIEYAEPNYIQKIDNEVETEPPQFNDILSSVLKIGGSDVSNSIGIKENLANDPYFNLQWGLKNTGNNFDDSDEEDLREVPLKAGVDINVESIWSQGVTGNEEIVIAVIDSGIDYNHEDLKENLWDNGHGGCGYSAVYDSEIDKKNGRVKNCLKNEHMNISWHGTAVAGIIGARGNNGEGISGVMQKVQIMPICAGEDGKKLSKSAILKGLFFLEDRLENGVPIKAVNMSFGIYVKTKIDDEIEKELHICHLIY